MTLAFLSAAVLIYAALTGDQETLLICTFVSALVGPLIIAVVTYRLGHRVGQKVDAVHYEVKPPSNGTTTGAYAETNSAWWAWVYEELRAIGNRVGLEPHSPPPKLPEVEPPDRPK